MRSLSFDTLSADEFDTFSRQARYGNFQQSVMAAKARRLEGIRTQFLGIREGGGRHIVAAALVETRGSGLRTYCTIHDGPLCDFDDRELTVFFLKHLADYARSQGAVHLDITPEQPYQIRDDHGRPLAGHAPDTAMMDNLAAAGMVHEGFTRGYTAVPRWRFVKNLTNINNSDQLLDSYSKRTQWSVKRAQSMGVRVRQIDRDELGIFATIEKDTAERRHFDYRDEEYFRQFAAGYGEQAHFLLAEIDTQSYAQSMRNKVEDLQRLVDGLDRKIAVRETTRLQRRLKEESSNLAAAQKRYAEADRLLERGRYIPIAASLFVDMPQEVVYLFSGSVEEFKPFYGSALIQYEAMLRLCVEKGITRYNFYGIDGIFDDPDDEGRGVLEFKQGFDGYVEELPGTFMRVLRPGVYRLEQWAHRLLHR